MKQTKVQLYQVLSEIVFDLYKLNSVINDLKFNLKLRLPNKLLFLLENLFVSKVTLENLKGIRQFIVDTTKIVEDKLLDIKNLEMTNERIKKALNNANQEIQDLKNELEKVVIQPKQTTISFNEINNALKEENNDLKKKIDLQYLTFGKEIILMRDNLCMKEEMLKIDDNYKESTSWKLIQNAYRETENILNKMEITVINQTGMFDNIIQMVTDTVSTDCEELDNTVAQTFREGYRTEDKLIRPQEVILYSYKR